MSGNAAMPQLPRDFALLVAYWRRKRAGRAMPRRADIDPTEFPGRIWPHLVLIEVVRHDGRIRFRFRVVGAVFEEAFGRNPTGLYQDEVIPADAVYRDYISDLYNEVLEGKRPHYTENIFTLPGQSVPTTSKRLILPLANDGTTVSALLNAYEYEYPAGRAQHFADTMVAFKELAREHLDP
jgi:hypothetical protein